MTQVMKGIRMLEVAQFTFVPAAGAVLTDWGADVIKIEHPIRGDAQRGIKELQRFAVDQRRNALMQHPNRGKRSVGIDVSTPEGQELIYEIARTCDIFLTNYLPAQRQKLKIDIEHIAAHLYTKGQPDPDLVIRTSGEQRLSGFLLWQSAHSEFYFCEAYWPNFRKIDFLRAVRSYAARNRRFGI